MFGNLKSAPKTSTTQLEQDCLQCLQGFDQRWAASRRTRPSHFGDGRPFEPDPLVADLRGVFWRSCFISHPGEECDEMGSIIFLMATLVALDPDQGVDFLRWLSLVSAFRMALIARGATEDERTVSRFALYVMEYWKSTGEHDAWIASTDGITDADQLTKLSSERPLQVRDPKPID
jgi:hypothetical protein